MFLLYNETRIVHGGAFTNSLRIRYRVAVLKILNQPPHGLKLLSSRSSVKPLTFAMSTGSLTGTLRLHKLINHFLSTYSTFSYTCSQIHLLFIHASLAASTCNFSAVFRIVGTVDCEGHISAQWRALFFHADGPQ